MIQFMVNEDRSALLPTNDAGRVALAQYTPGQAVPIVFPETASHRDLRRRVFGVLRAVARALDTNPERMRIVMLLRTGRCHVIQIPVQAIDKNGNSITEQRAVAVVQSMARQFMDEDELRKFYQQMREFIRDQMLPDIPDWAQSDIRALIDA